MLLAAIKLRSDETRSLSPTYSKEPVVDGDRFRPLISSSFKREFSKFPNGLKDWLRLLFWSMLLGAKDARPGRGSRGLTGETAPSGEEMEQPEPRIHFPGGPAKQAGAARVCREGVSVRSRAGHVAWCREVACLSSLLEPSLRDTAITAHNAYNYGKWFRFLGRRRGRERRQLPAGGAGARFKIGFAG